MTKLDLTSSALEQGVEAAREFLDRVIGPAADEVGLLLRDSVAFWKFKNQVRILQKARDYCGKRGIEPAEVSLKLLCPLLEHAALEEEEELQDRWAILLGNLVDSEQNIENHVFPYVLSQISLTEFNFLNGACERRRKRVDDLEAELDAFLKERETAQKALEAEIADVDREIAKRPKEGRYRFDPETAQLRTKKSGLTMDLWKLRHRESSLRDSLAAPQVLPEDEMKEFEIANLVRLGLAREVREAHTHSEAIEIPDDYDGGRRSVPVYVDVELEEYFVVTELGELFVGACTDKHAQAKAAE